MKVKILIDNNEYEIELDEKIINKIKEDEELKYKRWRARLNEAYFYLFKNGEIDKCLERHDPTDNFRYFIGNYGETKEALEIYKRKLLLKQQYKDFIGKDLPTTDDWKSNSSKYFAYYDFYEKKIKIGEHLWCKTSNDIYSKSETKIKDFIIKIGNDDFKKYILEVDD